MSTSKALLAGVVLAALGSLVSGPAHAQDLSRYREFAFGSSIESVATATRALPSDVTILHQRPRLIQELVWRPRYTLGRSMTADPAREIQFRFLDDQLFRIVVLYDAHEIEGLTMQDLVRAISTVYGEPVANSRPAVARWQDEGFTMTLSEDSYPSPYRLVLVSAALEQLALSASTEAERLDRIEAPKKEAERRASVAEQRRVDDAATREKNKAGFRP
jgi:hypothetical protein